MIGRFVKAIFLLMPACSPAAVTEYQIESNTKTGDVPGYTVISNSDKSLTSEFNETVYLAPVYSSS